jgi:Fe-Mn family superoxide dismutase
MAYELPPLAYDYAALEPTIDEQTMRIHHDKHHQAYVDNLNKAVDGTEFDGRPLQELLGALEEIAPADKQTAIRNNGGGHANHSLFWELMAPGGSGEPTGDLAAAITDLWGGVDELKTAVNDNGVKRFGSGWTWLVWDGTALSLYSTPNQDSPWLQGHVPLLGNDVWEHAYYLKHQNKRPDYLAAWWNVVNWDVVGARFDAARGRGEVKLDY